MIALWLALGLAAATPRSAIPFEVAHTPPPVDYAGVASAPPIAHWTAPLPGPKLNAGSHAERARPVVVGDEIWVGSAGGTALWRISRRDGSFIGSFPATGAVQSEPVVVDGAVYFADTAGFTWCYSVDGKLRWKHDSGAPVLVAPTVSDGLVYVANVDGLVVALDADTGELHWRYKRRGDLGRRSELTLFAAPRPTRIGDELVVGFSDGAVVGLQAVRGDALWERQVGEGRYPDVVSAPAWWGNDLYASGYFEPLVAIDRRTHNVRWRIEAGAASQPIVVESTRTPMLIHPGSDGVLRGVAALTGAQVWTWVSDTGASLTTPVETPAGLLVGASAGSLYLIDAETGAELWRYHEDKLLAGVTAAPVVDGRQVLVVTNAGRIHSLLVPAPSAARQDVWAVGPGAVKAAREQR